MGGMIAVFAPWKTRCQELKKVWMIPDFQPAQTVTGHAECTAGFAGQPRRYPKTLESMDFFLPPDPMPQDL